jgi:hypothetical protein
VFLGLGSVVKNCSYRQKFSATLHQRGKSRTGDGHCRAILHGTGVTDNPDKIDNYIKACAFPITYSVDDDPEVMDEMKIAVAELKGGNNNDNDEAEMSSDKSSDRSDEDEWEEDEDGSEGRSKTN